MSKHDKFTTFAYREIDYSPILSCFSMKKILLHSILLMAVWFISASLLSCQKSHLVEEWPDRTEQDANGRNGQTEQGDTINVTPEFDINGWEGSIDADFTFGGEDTK